MCLVALYVYHIRLKFHLTWAIIMGFFSQGITIKHLFEVVLITSIPVHWPFFPDTASSDHGPPSQAVDFHCLSLPAVVIKNINWRPSSVDITEEKIS